MEKKEKKAFFTNEVILSSIIGLVIGAIIMFAVLYFVNNSAVIKVKGDKITKDELFGKMKEYFAVGLVIDEIDKMILPEKYALTDDMKTDIEEEAEYYLSMYESYYEFTEEEFLKENGFENKQEFLDYLGLDYRRNLYYYDYLESKLEDGAVQAYYDANKADVDKAENEHILVTVAEGATDKEEKEALALANEIIAKLNDGKSFEDVATEYAEKSTHEELGFIGKNDPFVQEYLDALFALEDGKYSTEPVKTKYGYHIIHRTATSTVEDVRKDIIEILAEDIIAEDENLYERALIELREEYNLDIEDETLREKYETYINDLSGNETSLKEMSANSNLKVRNIFAVLFGTVIAIVIAVILGIKLNSKTIGIISVILGVISLIGLEYYNTFFLICTLIFTIPTIILGVIGIKRGNIFALIGCILGVVVLLKFGLEFINSYMVSRWFEQAIESSKNNAENELNEETLESGVIEVNGIKVDLNM